MVGHRHKHVQTHWIRMLMLPALIAALVACVGSNEGTLSPDLTTETLSVPQSREVETSEITVTGASVWSPEARDCSIPNAFPPEEAQLIWPTLHEVQLVQAAPGDQVEIRGTGGFLYWNNECGEFRNESAIDFQLLLDGEPVDSITCYAHACLVNLTIPADASPGIHTISVEGGSNIDIQIGDRTPF
jgi:hypothetical protein